MIDCFRQKDSKGKGRWFMSVLDRATMYHQVSLIRDHTPETFVDHFMIFWVKWAGKPLEVSIDLETGLGSREFALALGEGGINVVPSAGQAHWQHGKVERRGAILKDMITRVINQLKVHEDDRLGWLVDEITMAKNMLIREHGFSPSQLLFGKEPRAFGEVEENGEPVAYQKRAKVAQRMRMRVEARQAFIASESKQMVMQTARNRARPWTEPQIGDRCFFYREFRKKGVTGLAWTGLSCGNPGSVQCLVGFPG